MSDDTRKGKIARLPNHIREELNRRLLDGQPGPKILPWLNKLPEVRSILKEDFDGLKVRAQNLSEWRKGGYQDWLKRRERVVATQELARFCADLSKAKGQTISDGAAAIAAGKLLSMLEDMADEDAPDAETFSALANALSKIRAGDHNVIKLGQARVQLKHAAEALELERQKFKRETCELFLEWFANHQAAKIAGSDASHAQKIDQLGALMFGELWKTDNKPKDTK